ncbi:MAG: alkaline phosphatase family protein [Planctomycetota bacterium]
MSIIRSLHLVLLLVAICASALWTMDRLTAPIAAADDAGTGDAGDGRPSHPGSDRMFVFVVDSLRYETAIDPERMPFLAAFRARALHGKMLPTHDAVTVPALRAAFTGEDRISVFGFVKNFRHRAEGFASLFTQLGADGGRTAVWSDGSFRQFDGDLAVREPHLVGEGDRLTRQNNAVEAGLARFLDGDDRLVIVHVTYSDHVAHQVGIHGERYHEEYLVVDDVIRSLDERLPPDASFVVMGDHGHDELGRHMMGLDVPTLFLARGPAFRAGHDLGTIPITDTRYLLGWGLGLPLVAGYQAGRHPDGLVTDTSLPAAYAAAFDALAARDTEGSGVMPGRRGLFVLAMSAAALVAGLWVCLVGGRPGPVTDVGAWLAVGCIAVLPPLAGAIAGGIVAAALVFRRVNADHRRVLWLTALAGIGFVALGLGLSLVRTLVHYPSYLHITVAWVVVAGAAAVVSWKVGPRWVVAVLTIACLVGLYPTVYRYGTVATMAPLWLTGLALVSLAAARSATDRGWAGPAALRLGGVALLLSPFLLVNSVHFEFTSWVLPVATALWGTLHATEPLALGYAVAFVAKLVVFVRPRLGLLPVAAGVAATVTIQAAEMQVAGLAPSAETKWLYLGVCAVALVVALVLRRRAAVDAVHDQFARIGWIVALQLLFLYTVRIPPAAYLWADMLFAAAVLSGAFLRDEPSGALRPGGHLFLLVLAVMATGWCTIAWTFHRLEWGILYDWFDAAYIEWNVGLFLPAIVLRYCLPLMIFRLLLAETVGPRDPYPQRAALLVTGGKALAVCLVACGMGCHRVRSDVYLEAVQETAIWGLMAFVVAWPARKRKPRP